MRQRLVCLVVALTCLLSACQSRKPQQTAKPDDVQTALGANAASGSTDMRTPEQRKSEARVRAAQQVRINALQDIVGDLRTQGIDVRKTPAKKAWRLIVPSLNKVHDPVLRKRQADQIAADFKRRIEPVMERKIEVQIYLDPKETHAIP